MGDPFKDTSSVSLNPVIKFTTLFGLLAVELAVSISNNMDNHVLTWILAAVFFLISFTFVWRSFYAVRIKRTLRSDGPSSETLPNHAKFPTSSCAC